jgi:hypothetical protein
MKFSDRRQKCSYYNLLINVAAQHFFQDCPTAPWDGGMLSIFTPILMNSSKVKNDQEWSFRRKPKSEA